MKRSGISPSGVMNIPEPCVESVRWFPYRIPFRTSFTTAHGTLTERRGALVEIVSNNNLSGIGEIAPLPEFAGDDLSTALTALSAFYLKLCGMPLSSALDLLYMTASDLPATTVYGLESALLDLLGKFRECRVGELYNGSLPGDRSEYIGTGMVNPVCPVIRERVDVNVVVGAMEVERAVMQAREAVRAGYRCIKLKVGSRRVEDEIARIAAVRAAIGSAIDLRLDANEAWTFAEASAILNRCAAYHIQYVEQPLPAGNLAEMRALRYNVPVPIAVDEAVYDLASVRRVFACDAADVLILKPQLAGGLRAGRQMISEATLHKVQCVITSTIETGIGIVGALHLAAASPEVTLACGLATSHLLVDDLLIDPLIPDHGSLVVPIGFGLGVRLDRDALAHYRTDRKDGI